MNTQDFTTTILVDQSPKAVFDAINNVRGWWSEEIEGPTSKLNDEFQYHYQDVHRCQMRIVESIPDQKVVWLVVNNYFNFTKDGTEWTGTRVCFEIATRGNQTELRFTHLGLVPEYECYDACRDGWTNYIQNSLRSLIVTGKGQPNSSETARTEHEERLGSAQGKSTGETTAQHYTTRILVNATPHEAYEAINNVKLWWTGDLEGDSHKVDDTFTVQFADIHVSTQKVVALVPDQKVEWLVTASDLSFIRDRQEWNNTRIRFEISEKNGQTQIDFTHFGLVPAVECYQDCVKGWDYFINGSLFQLLNEGKGTPGLVGAE